MNKYAEIAIRAAKMLQREKGVSPLGAWKESALAVFPDNLCARNKSCPKSSFLGLCEAGFLRSVPKGSYTSSTKNKNYAVKAIKLLKRNPNLNEKELWDKVQQGELSKKYNQQMHVVHGLFKAGFVL